MLNKIASKFLIQKLNSSGMGAASEKAAVSAFRRAATHTPWYHAILNAEGVNFNAIKTIAQFKAAVPILTKQSIFGAHTPAKLLNGKLDHILQLSLSSGTTGIPSFGMDSHYEIKKATQNTDLFLKLLIGVDRRNTLIINCSGMGVKAFTRCTVCEPGCREDLVASILNAVGDQFENVVIATSPGFLKRLVEHCIANGIDFQRLNTFFITGGEYFPESMRSYIHSICGKSLQRPKQGYWLSIYGLTELGYPIMFETATSALMRTRQSGKSAAESQASNSAPYTLAQPYFFHYVPFQYYVETVPTHQGDQLVFTGLSKRSVPMIRYNTGDLGELLQNDFSNRPNPALANSRDPLSVCPLVKFRGRANSRMLPAENDVLELLFREHDIAAATTGYFTLKQQSECVEINIQLEKGKTAEDNLRRRIQKNFDRELAVSTTVCLSEYHQMKQQMTLDFSRKFNHIAP